jgi:non-haem Fe2+, alpha-ketoglutarate-dependent halogenase
VRGKDEYGNFDDERRPLEEAGPAERAFHAEAVARFRSMNAVESDENKVAVVKR